MSQYLSSVPLSWLLSRSGAVSGIGKRPKVSLILKSGSASDRPVPPRVLSQHPMSLSPAHLTFTFPGLLDALVSVRTWRLIPDLSRCISAGFVGDTFSLR